MIIKIKTRVDRNGNTYGLIFDTEKKTYKKGYYVCHSADLYATKKDIMNFIKYNLSDFSEVE